MKLEEEKSDTYFNSRPRASRIGAWASDQSSELISRAELEDKVKKLTEEYEARKLKDRLFGVAISSSQLQLNFGRDAHRVCTIGSATP